MTSPFFAAVRGLRRRPGFAAVSITTIALATGANTATWSIVSGALLRPLPFREPERLEVKPLDLMTYVLVAVVLGATSLVAAWLPARRAARVDPVKVLGDEG